MKIVSPRKNEIERNIFIVIPKKNKLNEFAKKIIDL